MSGWVCAPVSEGAFRVQSRLSKTLELGFQAASMGVGTELKLSARAVCTLTGRAVCSPSSLVCVQFGGIVCDCCC